MKKLIALLAVAGILTFGISNTLLAQEEGQAQAQATEQVIDNAQTNPLAAPKTDATFHEVLKKQFIDGGWEFMTIILFILVLGLAVSIERIIYLSLSTTNTKKLLAQLEETLNKQGVEKAKDLCRDTRGPVASIFYQGLMRYNEGLEEVEKSIVSYGSVMTGNLESGASWISLFIALGPMLGFMGTVIGMIEAFDAIAAAGDISPTVVAGGMKVALLTTVFGLIVAVILQICYNFILNKIEGIVNDMEDSSITFMDILHNYSKKN
ncbi:MAG: MotA/TolQ/ExbB proton channel family protein [Bacteroidales bacterium]|nr:MotA/TolQ/ExbB proton channel family protein [Bacteroidales bacterium]